MELSDGRSSSLSKEARWHLPCWMCCGACDYVGLASFALTTGWPCLAQGLNRHAAFKGKAWLWTLLFLFMLLPIYIATYSYDTHTTRCGETKNSEKSDYACITTHRVHPYVFIVFFSVGCIFLLVWAVMGACHRMAIRREYNIPGNKWKDCFLWLFCSPFALCQETRTLMYHSIRDSTILGDKSIILATAPSKENMDRDSVEDIPL